MSRVIRFSRTFPAYHPKAGQPTYFVEKIWKGLYDKQGNGYDPSGGYQDSHDNHFHPMGKGLKNIHQFIPKYHTIRAGNRWKVGDKFSPRVWSGKPYSTKQIVIAPDIPIKKVYSIEIFETSEVLINGKFFCSFGSENWELLSRNDGLDSKDMRNWFSKLPFKGQIICWNENINY